MTNDQRAVLAEVFDGAAATYDAVGVSFFQPIASGLVEALAIRAGEHVLDIGCGRGAALVPIAEAATPGGRVVGIDLSPNMVAATAADVAAAGLDVEVRVDDAQNPAVTGPFDAIAASLVLFFLPDPAEALRTWHALLRPGGRVGISTFGDFSPAWHDVDAVFAPYLPPNLADPRTQAAESPFGSDLGVEQLFATAGFDSIRTTHLTVEARFDDADQWYRWTRSQGQRRMWDLVPESERPDVIAEAALRLEATRDDSGRMGFDQVIRYTFGDRPG